VRGPEIPELPPGTTPGWWLNVFPTAGEASGSFRYTERLIRPITGDRLPIDPTRSRGEAARRAATRLRRYGAGNRLNRFGTLTYKGDGCFDPVQVRHDIADFFRRLRSLRGGDPFPYAWVPEWHPGGHGLHVHFAVGSYIHRTLIEEAWSRGFIKMKRIGDLPIGSGPLQEARVAASYLAKYVKKDFAQDKIPGLHRYDVAEGFTPERVRVYGRTAQDAIETATAFFGGALPSLRWESINDAHEWFGPPAVWLAW
jgi:hypothetical protein